MMPTKERYPSSYLIECDGTRVLLDCGHMTIPRLLEHGIDLFSLDAIVLTHFHADHIAHLLPIVFARFVDAAERNIQNRELAIIGPPTLKDRYQKLREVMWPEAQTPPIRIIEIDKNLFMHGPFSFSPFPVIHSALFPCRGYRIEAAGKMLVYTGDMGCEQESGFEKNLQNADLLLIECGTDKESKNHCTPGRAIAFGTEAGAKRIILTHISAHRIPGITQSIAPHASIVTLAEDGMQVTL